MSQNQSNKPILIIADIHLQPEQGHPINQHFKSFLKTQLKQVEALYILGDLFEMWVGDDIGIDTYRPFIELFSQLSQQGLAIYLQYGNRDFLMQKAFCQATGIQILPDIKVVSFFNTPYLLLHGDTLCTDDKDYQKMRNIVRNPVVQFLFLKLSRKRRLAIGEKMRQSSKKHSQNKQAEIMDVNQQAVEQLFQRYPQVENMIHGHTHRPQKHTLKVDGQTKYRWVLGDWRPKSKIIKITESGAELIDY